MDAHNFEDINVHQVYSQIALHFAQTRAYLWKGVKEFVNSLTPGEAVLDAGCGNGKNMFRRDLKFTGIDTCQEFVKIASQYGETSLGNIIELKFSDNSFDAIICVAVLHHLSTEERRLQALKEFARVLKPGGKLFIQVWAKENNTRKKIDEYDTEKHDCMIPWQPTKRFKLESGEEKVFRYYHLFTQGELASLAKQAGFTIERDFYEKENWGIIGSL